jgi:acylglycerol lipase
MGHSMGGNEVLTWLASTDPTIVQVKKSIRGFLAEAPFIRSTDTQSSIVTAVAKMAGTILPHHQKVYAMDSALFCRDPEVNRWFDEDELCHDTGTHEGVSALIERGKALDSGKAMIEEGVGEGGRTRIWLGHGDADGLCDHRGTKELFERLVDVEDRTLKIFEGCYHQRECYQDSRKGFTKIN